jgi:hypothetical protein
MAMVQGKSNEALALSFTVDNVASRLPVNFTLGNFTQVRTISLGPWAVAAHLLCSRFLLCTESERVLVPAACLVSSACGG